MTTLTAGWIDVHGHFDVPATAEQQHARLEAMIAKGFTGTLEDLLWSAEKNLKHMDRNGITMQLVSNYGPQTTEAMIASNTFGAALVAQYPDRFGLLVSLPLAEPERALAEIRRGLDELDADGFAIQSNYGGMYLGDPRLQPVWAELDRLGATVFLHPTPFGLEALSLGRPAALLEVTFDTARTVFDMVFAGVFRAYPNFNLVLAHAGGTLPTVAARIAALGPLNWVPNPNRLTSGEIREQLSGLYFDTGLAGNEHSLAPVLAVTGPDHLVYGSDFGAPCTDDGVVTANLVSVRAYERLNHEDREAIGANAACIFPKAATRAAQNSRSFPQRQSV